MLYAIFQVGYRSGLSTSKSIADLHSTPDREIFKTPKFGTPGKNFFIFKWFVTPVNFALYILIIVSVFFSIYFIWYNKI